MRLKWRLRKSSRGLISGRVVLVCVAALSIFLARNAPVILPHIFSTPAVNSLAAHEHRFCFDHEGLQWGHFARSMAMAPPTASSPHLVYSVAVSIEFVTEGWHYNRPPPIT